MKTRRTLAFLAISAVLTLGAQAFIPVAGACGGTLPGSCRSETTNTPRSADDGILARVSGWFSSLFG